MNEVRMRTDGHRDGYRVICKYCPKCGSNDLRYSFANAGRDLVRCMECGLLFSKKNRVIKLTSF